MKIETTSMRFQGLALAQSGQAARVPTAAPSLISIGRIFRPSTTGRSTSAPGDLLDDEALEGVASLRPRHRLAHENIGKTPGQGPENLLGVSVTQTVSSHRRRPKPVSAPVRVFHSASV